MHGRIIVIKGTGWQNTGEQEVKTMDKLIARLVKCGMPRDVALAVYRSFKRANNLWEFERYVEGVEEECREPVEEI